MAAPSKEQREYSDAKRTILKFEREHPWARKPLKPRKRREKCKMQ
ncbi:hypothetical protein LCGC14_0925860 [marine sediment metagenome]|uniref:Uncharacterized protein n=1 Tax=marine sediment metagenome TaxID=412755 RepID=A0A0F9R880_9ZZZZ